MEYHSRTVLYRNTKCCDESKCSSTVEVKKTDPFYETSEPTSYSNKFRNYTEGKKQNDAQKVNINMCSGTNIVENKNKQDIFKPRCYQYDALILRIRSLLNELKAIKNNEATGMCEFCKRYNSTGKCKRCEILSKNYGSRPAVDKEALHERFKLWIFKVKQFLYMILEREVCKHKLYHGNSTEPDELENLLYEFKSPLNIREPYIDHFLSVDSLENISESKDILEEILMKFKNKKMYHATYVSDPYYTSTSGEVPHTFAFVNKFPPNTSNISIDPLTLIRITEDAEHEIMNSKHSQSQTDIQFQGGTNTNAKIKFGNETERLHLASKMQKDGKSLSETKTKVNEKTKVNSKGKSQNLRNSYKQPDEFFDSSEKRDREHNIKTDGENKKQNKRISASNKERNLSEKTGVVDTERKMQTISNKDKEISDMKVHRIERYSNLKSDSGRPRTEKEKDIKSKNSKKNAHDLVSTNTKSGFKIQKQTKEKNNINDKQKHSSDDELLAMLLKSASKKEEKKEKVESKHADKPLQLPKIEELPIVKRKLPKRAIEKIISDSVIECSLLNEEPREMVKGTKITSIESRGDPDAGSIKPMLFKMQSQFGVDETLEDSRVLTSSENLKPKKNRSNAVLEHKSSKGVIKYSLSNREFIEKGWTMLPTTKIMRRMNIYKMVPSNPKSDWFKRHKPGEVKLYDSGEKFAEIDEDGSGKWFYKNGLLALEYYIPQDTNSGYRYVIYSSGEKDAGRDLPVTILALFDHLGNGVIYDHYGNERLKYNQSEGVVFDDKIGCPGRWKWHTLNEPPVLQPVFVDTHVKRDSCFNKLKAQKDDDKSNDNSNCMKEPNLDMLTIELENFMKEKANKLLQKFKPFHVKMKACKINDKFSLKILGQSNIYLLFRDGQTSMKLNLGMVLVSNEIVDTDTSEVTQVATAYDRHPPKSQSIANIQNVLEKAKNLGKTRSKLR